MKTYLILTDYSETRFETNDTAWEREIGDTMQIDGTPMRIIAIFKNEQERNHAWNILAKAIRSRNNRIRYQQEKETNRIFSNLLMQAAESCGIDESDAIQAIKNLI